jgi:hypothetical protein
MSPQSLKKFVKNAQKRKVIVKNKITPAIRVKVHPKGNVNQEPFAANWVFLPVEKTK